MIKEFKEFISRGNVMDMAVGVIIGAAFTSIVNSLVNNIINPFIGIFVGKIDLSNLTWKVGGATFKFGVFINAVINFLIIAFVVFLLVKMVNKLFPKKLADPEPAQPSAEESLAKIVKMLEEKQ
ncbi:large conductance mechanosensitive channel protein [Limosilactobacillus coleohominis 101-4-CHN]|uniref:Large-conductance mechanosensitive channel n=1 Tax=Limosilactobacillus coleohominis 101-4-CHN TaxID=575594 RepID=C7XTY1_9LACO|nr:large-conductance mechanosensitive channel protein MscL [Limosilactobacillus coleohominis]EEU30742.1 large conductance mechanosensitive channel protein [Limosilactobacillus coleohominis 101-4-CHN]